MRRLDDAGTSTVFSFIVATSIFAIAFSSVTYFASDYIAEHEAEGESLDSVAAAAIGVLNSQPGAPSTWTATTPPDRLGLLKSGTTTTMDGDKIAAVASWGGDPTRYQEARESLGLEDYNIRIRAFPTFTVTSAGVTGLEEQRVAYVQSTDAVVATAERTALDGTGADFTNAVADTDLTDGYTAGDVFADTHSTLNTHFASRLHGFLGVHDGDQVTGDDSYWRVLDETGMDTTNPAGPTTRVLTMSLPSGGSWHYGSSRDILRLTTPLDRILLTEVDRTLAENGEDITLELEHWLRGDTSTPLPNDVVDDYGLVDFYCTAGCPPTPGWVVGKRLDNVGTKNDFSASTYSLSQLVPQGAKGYLALSWYSYDDGNPAVDDKGWFIRSIKVTTVTSGQTTTWENDLDFANTGYDALVVGSQVAQANLRDATDPLFDDTLKDWIDAGGDLIVTGSDNADTGWLTPLASGVATTPLSQSLYEDKTDTTHAVLNNPHHLRWSSYSTATRTYDLPSGLGDPFQKVVYHKMESPNPDRSFLSVGSAAWAGTYENSAAVITAYQPFAMGPVEATRFYANALVFTEFNDLELDFGAQVPSGRDVGTAQRSVVIDARGSGLGYLEGQMVVHVWR